MFSKPKVPTYDYWTNAIAESMSKNPDDWEVTKHGYVLNSKINVFVETNYGYIKVGTIGSSTFVTQTQDCKNKNIESCGKLIDYKLNKVVVLTNG